MLRQFKPQVLLIVKNVLGAPGILLVYWGIIRPYTQENAMEQFVRRHQDAIDHILSGFDRVLFRGTLRSISHLEGFLTFLCAHHILLKNFGVFVKSQSDLIKAHAQQYARDHNRPYVYIRSPKTSKEDIAREIMTRDGITKGLICVLSCVEPCMSYAIRKDRQAKRLRLIPQERKCLHFYFYLVDREFGFMHVRLQSWFPCSIQVCINGRECLARKMDKAGISYERRENCFLRIEDPQKAQKLADKMVKHNWPKLLNRFANCFNPLIRGSSGLDLHGYYWTVRQGEYATDVVFKNSSSLGKIYPRLTHHAIENFSAEDVMRFLGRRSNYRFPGEVVSDIKKRIEGVRVNHRVEENSIKMYDKFGCVLRIETTINNPRRFKVYRKTVRYGEHVHAWIPMRKGVADIYRRVELSRAANARYLEALSVIGDEQPSCSLFDSVSRPIYRNGRRYRGLRPIAPEEALLFKTLLHGEFLIRGFRNADLRKLLYPATKSQKEIRRARGRITRLIRLLRAHGLIRKVSKTRLYRVTTKGQLIMCTSLIFRQTDIPLLAKAA
jgi:hypothetical protein